MSPPTWFYLNNDIPILLFYVNMNYSFEHFTKSKEMVGVHF